MNNKRKFASVGIAFIFAALLIFGNTSCLQKTNEDAVITEQEVLDIQNAWGDGIINIGKVFTEKGDYKSAAIDHINKLYDYQEGEVLFKPTMASVKQFRTDFQGALSYFIGGDTTFKEDHGFAIKPWKEVRWESAGIKIMGNVAIAMGNYYFIPVNGEGEVKVEYSFVYTKDKEDNLKIILHDSHLPYSHE